MTDSNQTALTNGDLRRAAALAGNFARQDWEGVAAVLSEINDQSNPTRAILSVLQFYDGILPELRTEMAQQLISAYILRVAGQ